VHTEKLVRNQVGILFYAALALTLSFALSACDGSSPNSAENTELENSVQGFANSPDSAHIVAALQQSVSGIPVQNVNAIGETTLVLNKDSSASNISSLTPNLIGGVGAGATISYLLNVASSGKYQIQISESAFANNTGVDVFLNGTELGQIPFPNKNANDDYSFTPPLVVTFPVGQSTLEFKTLTGDFNINGITLAVTPPTVFPGAATTQSWVTAKAASTPINQLPSEFSTAYPQPLTNLGWEDGIYITRDGLNLYSTYIPADSLSYFFATITPGSNISPPNFYEFERGNLIGQDFSVPPFAAGLTKSWLHADIAISQRASTADAFTNWSLTGLKIQYSNRGAAVGILDTENPGLFDYFAYTDDTVTTTNPHGYAQIKIIRNSPLNPTTLGAGLPENVSTIGGVMYIQDNPHIERINPSNSNSLILMYDSTNQPGGSAKGDRDIWYTTSSDGGTTWANPALASTVDTPVDETQPHLYFDGKTWWLYFSSPNPADGKPAIYRASQEESGNWNAWGPRQLVVSAGTSGGVGEPTLTSQGDLSFAVISYNPKGTAKDSYDADPWFLPHRTSPSPTATPKPSPTATPKPSPTATPKPSPTATPKPSPTATPKPSPTATPKPSPTATPKNNVVLKGARILGMDTNNPAADYTFLQSYAAAQSIGVQAATLHIDWNTDEATGSGTTSGVMTDVGGALASANAYYPTTSPASMLSLTIAPIDTGSYKLPSDLNSLPQMSNATVITRFNKFMTWVLSQLPNTRFTSIQIGNEIDTLSAANTAAYWTQYATFLTSAVAHIHALKPGVKVGVTVTLYGITAQGYAGSAAQVGIKALAGIGDELGVTYYPLDNTYKMKAPSVVATETANMFAMLPTSTQVYFQEVGYASSSTCGGSQTNQSAFVDQIFSMWDTYSTRIPFLSFVRMNDLSSSTALTEASTLSGNSAFVAYLQTLGFRTDPAPSGFKSAWLELQSQTKLRGW